MGLSLWHLIVVLIIVLVLFGKGRIAPLMKELGSGLKSFKDGLNEQEKPKAKPKKKSK